MMGIAAQASYLTDALSGATALRSPFLAGPFAILPALDLEGDLLAASALGLEFVAQSVVALLVHPSCRLLTRPWGPVPTTAPPIAFVCPSIGVAGGGTCEEPHPPPRPARPAERKWQFQSSGRTSCYEPVPRSAMYTPSALRTWNNTFASSRKATTLVVIPVYGSDKNCVGPAYNTPVTCGSIR